MQALNCLIVEDEPLAADVIRDYILQVPGLKLAGIAEDVFAAMEQLRQQTVDIIFLDINLPKISGIDFLKTIQGKYDIVFTTAYHQYALEGFNLNAIDYLLKPVEFSRFLQAVNKVFEKHRRQLHKADNFSAARKFYFFNSGKKKIKVFLDEILYIEGLKDYVRIHTTSQKVITKFQIGEMNRVLDEKKFIRIHKSYLINIDKITAYHAGEVEIGSTLLPVGRTYQELVERQLDIFR